MSFQVALNSRNVLVPLSLEDRQGMRMRKELSRLDTATAMVIRVSASGAFRQEFIPLRIRQDSAAAYSGEEWELRVQKASSEFHVYYLGIPNPLFDASAGTEPPRSLSVQVVGTSPLTGREEFTGGVDVALAAQVEPPLIPGFLALSERFFPTLLPHNFISARSVAVFEHSGKRSLILMAGVQRDPADRIPVSLGKHWDAKNWIEAVVENLAPVSEGAEPAWYSIQGGCFYGRNRRLSHWFGGSIGLEDAGFRQAAAECIRSLGPSGNGAWVFWLEPHGDAAGHYETLKAPAAASRRTISIRHPILNKALAAPSPVPASARGELPGGMPLASASAALSGLAEILSRHQETLLKAIYEPSHASWSHPGSPALEAAFALEGKSGGLPPAASSQERLASDIRALYGGHGETLRALEAYFDEHGGYSPWDAAGNPLREALGGFLADARARVPA